MLSWRASWLDRITHHFQRSLFYITSELTISQQNLSKETMGAFLKLIDVILFIVFLVIAIGAPLLDAQTCLPSTLFPDILINLNTWYTHQFGDYLVSEKPHFFVGLIWLELLFAWPLALACLYGIVAGKSWLRITCLLYGVSTLTSMVWTSLSSFFPLQSMKENGNLQFGSSIISKNMIWYEQIHNGEVWS